MKDTKKWDVDVEVFAIALLLMLSSEVLVSDVWKYEEGWDRFLYPEKKTLNFAFKIVRFGACLVVLTVLFIYFFKFFLDFGAV